MGYGSRALTLLQSYYEGEFPSLDEGDGAKEIHKSTELGKKYYKVIMRESFPVWMTGMVPKKYTEYRVR